MSGCSWKTTSEAHLRYHDTEWGVPLHDDRGQFEFLMMEVMQCGLSWDLMLRKREIFRACFDNFEYDAVAGYHERDIERILNTDGMIRSRRKIEAVIHNARCFQKIRAESGSFCDYLWAYSGGRTILYNRHDAGWIPVSNNLSDKISKDLKGRGFKFLGTVTVYSHLQACGIINDHDRDCPRFHEINSRYPTVRKRRCLEKGIQYFGGPPLSASASGTLRNPARR
ncbi:MAG: DNA-3-methyladenine glycosylase I [Fretibacterium sp.]|nr:DNA-3-methyladenine glycosylase I [Fretibacterium sp.]